MLRIKTKNVAQKIISNRYFKLISDFNDSISFIKWSFWFQMTFPFLFLNCLYSRLSIFCFSFLSSFFFSFYLQFVTWSVQSSKDFPPLKINYPSIRNAVIFLSCGYFITFSPCTNPIKMAWDLLHSTFNSTFSLSVLRANCFAVPQKEKNKRKEKRVMVVAKAVDTPPS